MAGCYATLTVTGGSPSAVLHVASYADAASKSYPSLDFRAPWNADDAASLANETLNGQLWVQLEPGGVVWHTPDGEFTPLTIQAAAYDGPFIAKLDQCRLVITSPEDRRPCTGTFSGSLAVLLLQPNSSRSPPAENSFARSPETTQPAAGPNTRAASTWAT